MPPSSARLKREECPRTKHDSLFSPWKILIGPFDWEGHSVGKDGVQRYRIHNLPENFPGLYELGIARIPADEGIKTLRHDWSDIVVVYLGQADNVRARLQQYGRTGSHLDYGSSFAFTSKNGNDSVIAGPGLFREVFSRGYSLVFRCALMNDKRAAENTEAQLLKSFDYSWNKLQNGACRRREILLKLDEEATSRKSSLRRGVRHLKLRIFADKAGIKINRSGSVDTSSSIMKNFLPQVRKFVGYRPHLVNSGGFVGEDHDFYSMTTNGGNAWRNRQPHGGKRWEEKKAKNIAQTRHAAKQRTAAKQETSSVCGAMLEDGSSCLECPVQGRKRCELHKGRRAMGNCKSSSHGSPSDQMEIPILKANKSDQGYHTCGLLTDDRSICAEGSANQRKRFDTKKLTSGKDRLKNGIYEAARDSDICGVAMSHNSDCENKVISVRQRCELHNGSKMTQIDLSKLEDVFNNDDTGQQSCGVTNFHDGLSCPNKQVSGRMLFELIKGQKRTNTTAATCPEFPSRAMDDLNKEPIICGVVTDYGYCKRKPIAGRKRCQEHKGMRITAASFVPIVGGSGCSSICGASTSDGSPCMNQPVAGRKRCALHKGKRATSHCQS